MRKYFREAGVFGLFILSEEVSKRMNTTKKKKNTKESRSKSKSLNTKESRSKSLNTKEPRSNKSKSLNTKETRSNKSKSLANKYNKKLIIYNKYATAIQLLNGTTQYYYVRKQRKKKDPKNLPFKTNLYKTVLPKKNYLKLDRIVAGEFLVGELMVLFSFLTALSHISLVTFRKESYKNYIDKQINTQRWLEYSVTSSIMMFSFMGISLIDSLEELIPLTVLVGVTNIFGLGIESIKSIKDNNIRKILFYTGSVTNGLPWMYINYKNRKLFRLTREQIIDNMKNEGVKEEFDRTPAQFADFFINTLVPAIKILTYSMQALYYLFSLNMNQKYIKPMKYKTKLDSQEFYELERNYIFLSMFAKSLLSWTIWSATLRPNRNED